MKKFRTLLVFLCLSLIIAPFLINPVRADELDDISKQIEELSQAREQSVAATKPLESELNRLEGEINQIQGQINEAKSELQGLKASIASREADFGVQYALLSERVLSYYKSSRGPSALMMIFPSGISSGFIRDIFYQQVVTDKDKIVIAQISEELIKLEKDKQKVEEDTVRLADLQGKLDKEADFFEGEIAGAKAYQADLSKQIAALSAKQQELIARKFGSLNLPQSLGAGTLYCTDDRNIDPGFSPGLAFYTYGIPHRVGMNQYGAYGRSKAGQNYQDILRAYFNDISFEGGREGINIKVQGYGEMNLETYLLGIYEMPGDWPMEALKAQVVAARSYALAYTNNGAGEICTTQACQVYKGGNKGGQWEQAVIATKGQVMTHGGQPIKAWYSSTDGGYTFNSGDVWGGYTAYTKRTTDANGGVGSFSDLNERAYDKESPCFYSAQGWRSEYGKSAWLKPEEVADVVNVLMLAKADPSTQKHLSQVDKPNPDGEETWDAERVKSELRGRGQTPFNRVTDVSVSADFGSGQTTGVTLSGDAGSRSFGGSEFADYFNLRAPANIQIVGPLYKVEKR